MEAGAPRWDRLRNQRQGLAPPAEALRFRWIGRFLEAARRFQKYCSPLFIGGDRVRQKIDDRTIRAHVPSCRDAVDFFHHFRPSEMHRLIAISWPTPGAWRTITAPRRPRE